MSASDRKRELIKIEQKPLVRVDRTEGLCRLRLARGDRYNALDRATLAALSAALAQPRPGEVLLLEGEGGVFSVGPDVAELVSLAALEARTFSLLAHEVIDALERWPGVTIARMNGFALGTGLELALGCDVLIGDPDLRLGLPGLAWALVPCMGGLRRLACRVGAQVGSELFLSGDILDAHTARSLNLIDRVSADDRELAQLCRDLAEFGPSAVAALRDIRRKHHGAIDADAEAALFAQPFASGETQRRLRELLA